MRHGRALKRGRWLSLLVAGFIGYLLGDWHAVVMRATELSASQNIAMRFPEAKSNAVLADAAVDTPTDSANILAIGETRLALLSPDSMVSTRQVAQAPVRVPVQVASAEEGVPLPAATSVETIPVRPRYAGCDAVQDRDKDRDKARCCGAAEGRVEIGGCRH